MPNQGQMSDAKAVRSKEKNNYEQGKSGGKVMTKTRTGGNPSKGGGINRATQGAGPQH